MKTLSHILVALFCVFGVTLAISVDQSNREVATIAVYGLLVSGLLMAYVLGKTSTVDLS